MSKYLSKKGILALLSTVLMVQAVFALENELPIWPSKAPGSESLSLKDSLTNRPLGGSCTIDRAISMVDTPTITPFIPSNPNGTSIIICPGGAYVRIVYDVEGVDIARMFNEKGITAFVLKYRLPGDGHINGKYVTLQDAQRAIRYVKKNAAMWQLDTSKVGIMGCSAGGHAAASLATDWDKTVYTAVDAADAISAHPSFSIFLYPVITMQTGLTHAATCTALLGSAPSQSLLDEFSTEKHIKPQTPPAFIAVAVDDVSVVPANNSKLYIDSLTKMGIRNSYKIYTSGGHGKGICKATGTDFANWVADCKGWLDSMQLSTPTSIRGTQKITTSGKLNVAINQISNTLNIKSLTEKAINRIEISDINGKVVFSGNSNMNAICINTSNIAAGVYFIKSYDGKSNDIESIVIK